MSMLAARCSQAFDSKSKLRGRDYLSGHRVALGEPTDDEVVATVRNFDGGKYDVRIDWSTAVDGVLVASCSCPHFQEGSNCKHLWATLLEIDRVGWASRVPGTRSLGICVDEDESVDRDDFELEDEDEFADIDFEPPKKRVVGKSKKPAKPIAAKVPPEPWRNELQQVQTAASNLLSNTDQSLWSRSPSRPREAWYVINVGACFRENQLVVQFLQRERKQNGDWSKFKKLSIKRNEVQNFGIDDRALMHLLLGAQPTQSAYVYGGSYYSPDYRELRESVIPASLYDLVLPRLCATGRCRWILEEPQMPDADKQLTWDDGEPWRFRLDIAAHDDEQQWNITGCLERQDQTLPLSEPVLLLSSGLMLLPDRLTKLDAHADFGWLAVLRKVGSVKIPYRRRNEFLTALAKMPTLPQSALPDNLRDCQSTILPVGRLEVKPYKAGYYADQTKLMARVTFLYDDREVPWETTDAAILDAKTGRLVIRDRETESRLIEQLTSLGRAGVRQFSDRYSYGNNVFVADVQFPRKSLGDVVQALTAAGWQVKAEGKLIRRPGSFEINVTSNVDWFELHAEFDFDGVTASLPDLLAALRDGQKMITLGDGSQGLLPEEWLKKYAKLADLGQSKDGVVRFTTAQGAILDALLAAQPDARVDQNFAEFRRKLQAFSGVEPLDPPEGFTGTLREYQREGLGWLHFLREFRFGGCLADDMGLGKTVQVLALLESRRTRKMPRGETRQPSLVVVPKSLIFNWVEEAKRFTPGLRVLNYTGIGRRTIENLSEDCDVIVTTYGTLRQDIIKLKDTRFDYAILDESQAIKNSASQAAKACRLIQADHRLAMTGTPVENHLGELWSLFEFLNPGLLGRSTAFDSVSRLRNDSDRELLDILSRALRPYMLRRTKEQVLKELPEKTEQTIHCELSPKERKQYNDLRDYYRALLTNKVAESGLAKSKIHVLEALLRLRQVACHPGLLDKKQSNQPSAKLEALLEQIDEVAAEGHKALVFSQFTSLLSIVKKHLDERGVVYEYLDGKTRDRQAKVERFQTDGKCPLFLISLKAGGHGLNLTAADYVFILDPWWNPAVEAQAIDRAHRMGQTRRVFAYRLIAKDTVEDKILELQATKRDLADAILSADNSLLRNLTAEDLQLLLS
jgi:superfamily II DNA or RNA helicase